ncbi:[FeFe] hydrogenase H-cluster radical SAM maturase HydG [Marispirochaeta aestuarii]|uniref:[FeFe] hydrogenase H-cluster radical SAM maturase HydG n=1 Tax=Marispirochaeta aestuarii TaxID=1963862 RepID=UPI001E4095EF|nr:[FeFe] hydrogenase H-cluster radical SAM maturase HydG [Marispirochaeta aestuarii]
MTKLKTKPDFIDRKKLEHLGSLNEPDEGRRQEIISKARELKGLDLDEAAELLACSSPEAVQDLLSAAAFVKQEIYGPRMVLFAPLYAGNKCCNDCLYCGFRRSNTELTRVTLTREAIAAETLELLRQGHKRLLLLTGEAAEYTMDYTLMALETMYSVRDRKGSSIRRINVELAPMSVDNFRRLKEGKIGTYTCFQETYDPDLYRQYHPAGPKADYHWRLEVMDRAMEAGIDDVGLGVLFGLADYRKEVLSMLMHAAHLEERFGCGPHTVSVPRLEPALGAPVSESVPYPVSDLDFKKLVAVLRLTLPYTGIILSTRESAQLRSELFRYGVSQVSAGSRTNPGGYGEEQTREEEFSHSQFSLGDHRSLAEVVDNLADYGLVPSFCTGCYRMGRTGSDFMDLAKPGLIRQFCLPNGLATFAEYLEDYAPEELKKKGLTLIERIAADQQESIASMIRENSARVAGGERDIYV